VGAPSLPCKGLHKRMKKLIIILIIFILLHAIEAVSYIITKKPIDFFAFFFPAFYGFIAPFILQDVIFGRLKLMLASAICAASLSMLIGVYLVVLLRDFLTLMHPDSVNEFFSVYIWMGIIPSAIWALVFGYFMGRPTS
jgi:hypothetical protein